MKINVDCPVSRSFCWLLHSQPQLISKTKALWRFQITMEYHSTFSLAASSKILYTKPRGWSELGIESCRWGSRLQKRKPINSLFGRYFRMCSSGETEETHNLDVFAKDLSKLWFHQTRHCLLKSASQNALNFLKALWLREYLSKRKTQKEIYSKIQKRKQKEKDSFLNSNTVKIWHALLKIAKPQILYRFPPIVTFQKLKMKINLKTQWEPYRKHNLRTL